VLVVAILAVYLVRLRSSAAPPTPGAFAPLFWGGLVVVGLLIPLFLDFVGSRAKALGALTAVLVLVGGFVLRYVIVMVNA
jgi:formate-dependent nitrite reductase membrane component NrfD